MRHTIAIALIALLCTAGSAMAVPGNTLHHPMKKNFSGRAVGPTNLNPPCCKK